MSRRLMRLFMSGSAGAVLLLGTASQVWAKHPNPGHHWGNPVAGPEMSLGMAANALLLLGGVVLLLLENYRRHRKSGSLQER